MARKFTRLDLNIDEALDTRFRRVVFETKGMKRGNLTEALEEAIEAWIKQQQRESKKGRA